MGIEGYDIYIVGVGGQGVLTIGEIIADTAFKKGVPVNFFPTKGMSQRGGFVKAQLRLGREPVGPSMPIRGADLVISMERSESLKAIRYVKPGSDFILYGMVWAPTEVMLGRAPYPTEAEVWGEIEQAGGKVFCLDPKLLPELNGKPVRENFYVLGAALRQTGLKKIFQAEDFEAAISEHWTRGAEQNLFAFRAGLQAEVLHCLPDTL
jgi:indolepyruvate ferredoxin oxidoreductase beta subunit